MNTNTWEVSRLSDGVTTLTVNNWTSKSEFRIFVCSDQHRDSAFSNHDLEQYHMDWAASINAPMVFYGDLFCAMQARFDPRSSKSETPDELKRGHYFDELVKYNHSFYKKYRKNIVVIGKGNHETSVENRHETDLCGRLVELLNAPGDSNVQLGGYYGWVQIKLQFPGKTKWITKNLWYHHGAGGNAQQSKGMLDVGRIAEYMADADVCCLGHNHQNYSTYNKRMRITPQGRELEDICVHVRTPGYKNPHHPKVKKNNWSGNNLQKPTVQGGGWLIFRMKPGYAQDAKVDITYEAAI